MVIIMALVKAQVEIVCPHFIMLLLCLLACSNFKPYLKQIFIMGKCSVDTVKKNTQLA